MSTQLSEHFTLEEFFFSETAARMGVPVTLPPDDPSILANIKRWIDLLGEPVRAKVGRPIILLSGYRPPWLNKTVGGSPHSAHMFGRAGDCLAPGMTPAALATAVASTDLPFDQVILEFGRWCHIGIAPEGYEPRRQVLTAHKVGAPLQTQYTPGVHEEFFA